MGALNVKERLWMWGNQVDWYLKNDFSVGLWKFTWKECGNEFWQKATKVEGRVLYINGGYFGNSNLVVINPIQLAIAISTGKSCNVHCGSCYHDEVIVSFGKRTIREAGKKTKSLNHYDREEEEIEYLIKEYRESMKMASSEKDNV